MDLSTVNLFADIDEEVVEIEDYSSNEVAII